MIHMQKCGMCKNVQKCVPDIVKNLNFKAFNLMSRTNETRQIKVSAYVD